MTAIANSTGLAPPSSAPVLSLVSYTDTTIDVSCTSVSGATGYKFYKDGVLVATQAGTTYQYTGLTSNTAYALTCYASNGAGDSSASNTVNQTTKNLLTNLIAQWKDNDTSGSSTDSVAGTYTLSQIGTPGSAAGIVNNCRTLDGSSGFELAISDNSIAGIGTNWSFSTNFYLGSTAGSQSDIFTCRVSGSANLCYLLRAETTSLKIYVGNGSGTLNSFTVGTLTANAWHNFSMSFDDTTKEIRCRYDGGTIQSFTSSTKPASRTSHGLGRGCQPGTGEYLVSGSKLDATQFWTRKLTDAELLDMSTAKEL